MHPYFDYCCEVWDVFGETQSKPLQKLQNRAARIILNISNDVDYTIALRILWAGSHSKQKGIKAKARMMYKLLNKIGPKSLTNLFSYKSEKTNYHLRDISSGLYLPKPRTNSMKNSFMYDGAHIWNSIPKEIRESKSLSSFRNKITLVFGNFCKYNLPVNSSKHFVISFKLICYCSLVPVVLKQAREKTWM